VIGRTFSHFEITAKLGEGGMGAVYRAKDTRLGRDVAIKVLPEEFAAKGQRVERFRREARLLASLHHPHIASIFGLEQVGDESLLVLELVEGEELTALIARGPVPVEEACEIARQIAQGLEAAHAKGIIHRDMKPANIRLTQERQVKILDFGLARAFAESAPEPSGDTETEFAATLSSDSPADLTRPGVVMGTPAYMSPEQARGQNVDHRTDLWAFGVILFEMLSGRRLFQGETRTDITAAVLGGEIPWLELPARTPGFVRRLLRRCLERDPQRRLASAGYARLAIEDGLASPADATLSGAIAAAAEPRRWPRWGWPAGIAVAAFVVGSFIGPLSGWLGPRPTAQSKLPLRKLSVPLVPTGERTLMSHGPRISPDGTAVAYVDRGQVWLLDLAALEPRALGGTEGAVGPFWSPDSQWLGFLAGRSFVKIPRAGGRPVPLATLDDDVGSVAGGSAGWGGDVVAVGTTFSEMLQFPAAGGEIRTLMPNAPGDLDVHQVDALPDGRGWLFSLHAQNGEGNLGILEASGKRHDILSVDGDSFEGVTWSPTGHILFRRAQVASGIWALPFSLERMEVTGEPFLVAAGGHNPSVAADGTLTYRLAPAAPHSEIVWLDRSGNEIGVIAPAQTTYPWPDLSPDDAKVLLANGPPDSRDLYVYDTLTGLEQRVTFDKLIEYGGAWAPDGETIYYVEDGSYQLFEVSLVGGGEARLVHTGFMPSVTPGGEDLIYAHSATEKLDPNIVRRSRLEPDSEPVTLVATPGIDWFARVSPDGRYMVYASTESGREEIYLTTYPNGEGRWDVSHGGGGSNPRWRDDMKEILYTTADAIWSVEVELEGGIAIGRPRKLFERPTTRWSVSWPDGYDVTGDGERFVLLRPSTRDDLPPERIVVVQNWFAEFGR
jgi:Tol biopolymer transport system component